MTENALLQVRGLTKNFGGLVAVDDLDFDLHEGEVLGLIGPNGAGKTTTFNLVCGSLASSGGTIRLDQHPIHGLPPHRIAALRLMRTFQHNMPFEGMSLIDNILVGAHTRMTANLWAILGQTRKARSGEQEARDRATELLNFVGLADEVETDVSTLSFGQGRLLEIARALAGDPRVLLFDEPAAGLTPAECDRLSEIIRNIARRGIAVLLIEHDMRFLLPLADRVLVLNFGQKIADEGPDEIRTNPQVIAAYLGDPNAEEKSGPPLMSGAANA